MAILIPNCLTDLNILQDQLAISTTFPAYDVAVLTELINTCSRYILRICKRDMIKYSGSVTEYLDGAGSEYLTPKKFPIVSITSIHDDPNRDYEAATLIDADDYEIYNSEGGVIRYLEGTFENSHSNVKVVYIAGYSEFKVIVGSNDQIVFNEGASNLTATIAEGAYNAATLATAIKTAMDAAGATYTVTYSSISHKFTISATSAFSIPWNGANNSRAREFGKLIGFIISADDASATSHIADYPALGIPEDLIDACNAMVRFRYEELRERRIGKFSESRGEQSMSFDFSNLPIYIRELIAPFIVRRL